MLLCPAIFPFGSGKMTRPATLPFRISLLFRYNRQRESREQRTISSELEVPNASKSLLFLLNVGLEIARNTDEGKQWGKRDEIRGRNSSCNDFHVERISLVNSHEKALLTRGFKTAEIFFSSLPFQFYHPIYVKSSLFT